MQDKDVVIGETKETPEKKKGDTSPKSANKERRDSSSEDIGRKQQFAGTKDGKFQFRRMKQPKKDKSSKKSSKRDTRFQGDGVSFKAKLIGVDEVSDARGDKMCQESMHRLKLSVKALGPHKRKIVIFVSLQGIKIKDEKTSGLLYHHPVSLISFISQDISDARAFGYVAGSSEGQHEFIAIKTEKPAFHVVVALRDLFQTVLNWKQEEMNQAKKLEQDTDAASSTGSDSLQEKSSVNEIVTDSVSEEEKSTKEEENIYFDVILAEPFTLVEPDNSPKTVDDLLDLQDELNKLQQGIAQMDTSIAAATYTLDTNAEKDPFDTSFVTPSGPKIDAFRSIPFPSAAPGINQFQQSVNTQNEDKYAIFNLDYQPSIFTADPLPATEAATGDSSIIPDLTDLEEEIKMKSKPPSKPPRNVNKTTTSDSLVFADLDPLGVRPYVDKAEFFQDVKNPPKKVLNDLVSNGIMAFEDRQTVVSSPPFPLSSPPRNPASPNGLSSSSLPNTSILSNLKLSVGYPANGSFNPFGKEISSNGIADDHNSTSSPIPIPNQNRNINHRSMSNGSAGSPSSRSPVPLENGYGTSPTTNGSSPSGKNASGHQNGVSRPRPRPSSLNKGNFVPSSTCNMTIPDSDVVISRENMHSIANMLRGNGHRARAGSFPVEEGRRDYRIDGADIFTKKSDPFGDDFFCSLPKRVPNHLSKTEIRDCV